MQDLMQPFNIDLLLTLGKKSVGNLKQVKVLDIMTGMTKNFHPDGLYSTEIFGKMGDARRTKNFGYIDLNIPIFHPVYYYALLELKELYGEIISGKAYATFDHKTKDFVRSDPITGETGYKFFLDHFSKLTPEERPAPKRIFNIALVEKFKNSPLLDKVLVLPAGLRDYTVDENGKPSEDEINTFYRKVIGLSNVIENVLAGANEEYLDNMRYNLQLSFNSIYDYITDILKGKNKLIQGKWAGRNIDNSTRNVITPYVQRFTSKKDPQFVSSTKQVLGTYQFMRSIFPKAVQLVRDGFLSSVFIGPNSPANLVDKDTLKGVSVTVNSGFYDDWMTMDGLEKQFHRFRVRDLRHSSIEIEGKYLGLIYVGPISTSKDKHVKMFNCISELPSGLDKNLVRPISYAELFYLSIYPAASYTPSTITRYPITGYGSVYPGNNYLKSTVNGDVAVELDDNWQPTDKIASEVPRRDEPFFDALSPSTDHLGRMGADYDGDMTNYISYLLKDSSVELTKLLHSRNYYVGVDGRMAFSSSNDILDLVLFNMS